MKSGNEHIFAFLTELFALKPGSPGLRACSAYALISAYTGTPVNMLLKQSDIHETGLWLTRRTHTREQFSVFIPFPFELREHFDTLSICPKEISKARVGIEDINCFIKGLKKPGFQPTTVTELPLIFKLACDESPATRILMQNRLKWFANEVRPNSLSIPPLSTDALTNLQLKSWARRKLRMAEKTTTPASDLFGTPSAPWDATDS